MNKFATFVGVWIALALTVLAVGSARQHFGRQAPSLLPRFATPYQAVLLDNGQVYFGKLSDAGSQFPKMTDMYYVVNSTDPNTKETKQVLVKRGKELHAPTESFIDARHVIMIEDVGQDSRVGQLIRQAESGSASSAPAPNPK